MARTVLVIEDDGQPPDGWAANPANRPAWPPLDVEPNEAIHGLLADIGRRRAASAALGAESLRRPARPEANDGAQEGGRE